MTDTPTHCLVSGQKVDCRAAYGCVCHKPDPNPPTSSGDAWADALAYRDEYRRTRRRFLG